jgi:hypothetical protein
MLVAREHALAELSQSLLKPTFLGRYLARQDRSDLFVKRPKLLHGHRLEIMRFHFTNYSPDYADAGLLIDGRLSGIIRALLGRFSG